MRFYLIIFVAWLSILTESNAQQNPHQNIIISDQFSPNEPTIAIHPRQSNILMAGSNIDNLYLSKDGGYSWQFKKLRSTYGVWGDPVIVPDTAGNFYFFHLSNPPDGNWIDRIICQRTEDYGQTWTNGRDSNRAPQAVCRYDTAALDRVARGILLCASRLASF